MKIQLDTNILTRLAQPSHSHHTIALSAKQRLETQGHTLCIAPQNLFEFWVVATRPIGENGLGLAIDQAKLEFDQLKNAFALRLDSPSLLLEWERLIVVFDCKGKPAHDARIVAAMNVDNITHLLTFNKRDFTRYAGITLLDPAIIASAKEASKS